VYLRSVFFKPLERVLAQRSEATQGARKKAAEALDRANAKAEAYAQQVAAARNELYREQEEVRKKWREEQVIQITAARDSAESTVKEARARIAKEADEAKSTLAASSQALADQITQAILQRRTV
jgi:F0F1-type ATP synthase membrane subunit b/b'